MADSSVRELHGIVDICNCTMRRWWMIGTGLQRSLCTCIRCLFMYQNYLVRYVSMDMGIGKAVLSDAGDMFEVTCAM